MVVFSRVLRNVGIMGALALLAAPVPAQATITATTQKSLDFATAVRPLSGTKNIVLNIDGSLNAGSTTIQMLSTVTSQGLVNIKSNSNTTSINININNIQVPSGFTLDNFKVRYRSVTYNTASGDLPTGWLTGPKKAGQNIEIVARLRATSSVSVAQNQALSYNLVINEQ